MTTGSSSSSRRVLVTGGTGFIGRHTIESLESDGFEVHVASRSGRYEKGIAHRADLLNADDRRSLVSHLRPTHLLHLAWCTEHGSYWNDVANVDWAAATLDLVRLFVTAGGRRLVIVGSCAEYDWTIASEGPLREQENHGRPRTLYGRSKRATYDILAAYAEAADVSLAWALPFFLFGPGEDQRRLVPSLARALLAQRPATVEAGSLVRDFLDVRDAGEVIAALVGSDLQGRVNVGSGTGTSLADLGYQLAATLDASALLQAKHGNSLGDEPPSLVADISRIRNELPLRTFRSLQDSLVDTVDWWRARGR